MVAACRRAGIVHTASMTRISKCVALLALTGCFVLTGAAATFTFKSGAKFEGEVVEFKGTNSLVVRSAKDAKLYTITISMLADEDQHRLVELQSQITGAFGIKLGQSFRAVKTVEVSELSGIKYLASCPFTPTARVPNFSEYVVRVTPRSNHVYSVMASAYFGENSLKAYGERVKIVAALEEKYGKAEHTTSTDRDKMDVDTITKGNRIVEVRSMGCTHGDYEIARLAGTEVPVYPAFVVIEYRDLLLQNEAEKELREPIRGL